LAVKAHYRVVAQQPALLDADVGNLTGIEGAGGEPDPGRPTAVLLVGKFGGYSSAGAMKADLDYPERVAMSSLCDRLRPVTRWRRSLRIARYIAITFLLPVASQIALFLLLWHHFAHRP